MLLRVFHRTTFVYDGLAKESFNEIRLCPAETALQSRRRFRLKTEPFAALQPFTDYFGNSAHRFSYSPPHASLTIEAESEMATAPNAERPPVASVAAADPACEPDREAHIEFLQPSRYVPLDRELEEASRRALATRGTLWDDIRRIGHVVHRSLVYRPQSTGVETLASEALRLRAGVCQDFAHVALGLCRTAGIPARYVSGYFLSGAGDEAADGLPAQCEASHAWIEAHVPGTGWVGFDPTHDRIADERYVLLAVGRDYGDIRPISGTYRGAPAREMRVDVQVRRIASGGVPA